MLCKIREHLWGEPVDLRDVKTRNLIMIYQVCAKCGYSRRFVNGEKKPLRLDPQWEHARKYQKNTIVLLCAGSAGQLVDFFTNLPVAFTISITSLMIWTMIRITKSINH